MWCDDIMNDEWTVYGSRDCGWTMKQLEYLQEKQIPFFFVDCDVEKCPSITSFPTLINTYGEKIVGYKEI